MKLWQFSKIDESKVSSLLMRTDLSRIAAEILVSRGIFEDKDLESFFNADELSDPFEIKDMDKAVAAIQEAMDLGERICIYGDYDCDGVTSTALLYLYLTMLGADVICYIPERKEGYGLNALAIDAIADNGAKLIVTVDNGISALTESRYIESIGLKLVVTDHHQVGDTLPTALAVVNPHREDCPSKFKELAGVGVALKLCGALEGGDMNAVFEQFGDIAALGTIADVVSLTGENRIIVKQGLRLLENTENPGLFSLKQKCVKSKLTAITVAFSITPRINAAGRFGSPRDAFELLICDSDKADGCAQKLVELNDERKLSEQEIMRQITAYIDENPSVLDERVIILTGYDWHVGVIGIVAARILEIFSKPAFVISIDKDTGVAVGSARSMDGFNIYDSLYNCSSTMLKFGGHEKAGGFSLEAKYLKDFKQLMYSYCAQKYPQMPPLVTKADMVLRPEDLTLQNMACLDALEPFGMDNPEPVFAVLSAPVCNIISLRQGLHSKVVIGSGDKTAEVLFFYKSPDSLGFDKGDKIDLLVSVSKGEYRGKETLTVKAKDARPSGIKQAQYLAAKNAYESFARGEKLSRAYLDSMIPQRSEAVTVYKLLNKNRFLPFDLIFYKAYALGINYAKLRIIIDAFSEYNLCQIHRYEKSVKLLDANGRFDFESAKIILRLKQAREEAE